MCLGLPVHSLAIIKEQFDKYYADKEFLYN